MEAGRDRAESHEDMLAIVDELLAEVDEIKRQWDEVSRSLGGAPQGAPRAGRTAGPRKGDGADPRRLVAVEMMLAGRQRAEVEAHLRSTFGEEAAASIIAGVYGEVDDR